ncbi:hypothetical protein NKH17_31580 [Mesorhizobium sp. M1334]|uniref:hypothetical protein n=1 Tax=Mesorhizobium sp. M1334 TaxID=2957084 RepID=UPI00333A08A0
MAVFRISIEPRQKLLDFRSAIGVGTRGLVPDAEEQRRAERLEFLCGGNGPLDAGELNFVGAAALRKLLKFEKLGSPGLPEEARTAGLGGLRFRRVDVNALLLVVRVHEVHDRDRESAMPAAKSHGHQILFGKFEILMDGVHHVRQDLVRRIASMHAASDFSRREWTEVVALVIELAIVGLQPGIEFVAPQSPRNLIDCRVRDRAYSEEGI